MPGLGSAASALLPLSLIASAYEPFFRHLRADEPWERTVRDAARRGPVVYVLRSASLVDLLALAHLTRRLDLPPLSYANEGDDWVRPRGASPRMPLEERLFQAFSRGESAVLFLRRRPSVLERATVAHRGRAEDDAPLRALLQLSSARGLAVTLVPQVVVWSQRPERLGFSALDVVFGPVESPGDLRAGAQFLLNHKNGIVRAGEPLDLRAFCQSEREAPPRRLAVALLRRLEHERRAILGPVQKPYDRVREEVLRSPKLRAVLDEMSSGDAGKRVELEERARGMLLALEATPEGGVLRGLETVAEALADQVYAGIDVDLPGLERVRDAARRGTVVFLPSHKSHVDYLLLSFVLRKNALQIPLVAAGDNLAFFPVGPLFRRAGAFFIRRKFKGDKLYAVVVDAYIRRLLRDGWAIEFFLEGGRSRTGKLLPPQLGLLNMVVDAALGVEGRTVTFIPVSIGYERMMEGAAYARELSGAPKQREDARGLLELRRVLAQKYGRANVQFGEGLELAPLFAAVGAERGAVTPAKRRALVTRLAHRVMAEINRVTLVTPGALVATVLLSHRGRGIVQRELLAHAARLVVRLRAAGARLDEGLATREGGLREEGVREALSLFERAGLVLPHVPGDTLTAAAKQRPVAPRGDDVIYRIPDDKRIVLDYAKNIIVHFFAPRALVAVALFSGEGPPARSAVEARVLDLSRLFKHELIFRADAPFERIFDETVTGMLGDGELVASGDALLPGPGSLGWSGRAWLAFYAAIVRNFLESYRIAARAARLTQGGPLAEKALSDRALTVGEQMFLGGEIDRAEAVSRTVIDNAWSAFADLRWLTRREGKVSLEGPYAERPEGLEEEVSVYLRRRAIDAPF